MADGNDREIIKPNFPGIIEEGMDDPQPYPFLASIGFTDSELSRICLQEVQIVGFNALDENTVIVEFQGEEYSGIPVWVHTDRGARASMVKDQEQENPEQYFYGSPLLFPCPEGAKANLTTVYPPIGLAMVELPGEDGGEIVIHGIVQVLQSIRKTIIDDANDSIFKTYDGVLEFQASYFDYDIWLDSGNHNDPFVFVKYWLVDLYTQTVSTFPNKTYTGLIRGEVYEEHYSNLSHIYNDGYKLTKGDNAPLINWMKLSDYMIDGGVLPGLPGYQKYGITSFHSSPVQTPLNGRVGQAPEQLESSISGWVSNIFTIDGAPGKTIKTFFEPYSEFAIYTGTYSTSGADVGGWSELVLQHLVDHYFWFGQVCYGAFGNFINSNFIAGSYLWFSTGLTGKLYAEEIPDGVGGTIIIVGDVDPSTVNRQVEIVSYNSQYSMALNTIHIHTALVNSVLGWYEGAGDEWQHLDTVAIEDIDMWLIPYDIRKAFLEA